MELATFLVANMILAYCGLSLLIIKTNQQHNTTQPIQWKKERQKKKKHEESGRYSRWHYVSKRTVYLTEIFR